ncbi:TetR/AcrR family transcriptional regulator [Lichenihabitans sp. Uapishka_5]|uniref:TetR/AcrR family transcriptional regulator n=1 Tax=Lichenihabitans sp. Uapishka_5 TaxID=3037302 RepID=UPI0029E7DE14|nr:TetR/AcrR family transcriptional regulator [Lichenihabitans sp. Uapishka_5]MDX7949581.1 TetR/AcrR family transcriptional regulator [Lichenihabitans sp. Uapishka_5]
MTHRLSQARSRATLEKILAAAEAVVARDGFGGLTLDGVAAAAGISKGGLLYHFRSKDALIVAVAARKLDLLSEGMDRAAAARRGLPHPTLAGMIAHSTETYRNDEGFSRALLVAAVENSESLVHFREAFADVMARVRAEGTRPDMALAILFGVMGLQVMRTLGVTDLHPAEAETIFAALSDLAASMPAVADPND